MARTKGRFVNKKGQSVANHFKQLRMNFKKTDLSKGTVYYEIFNSKKYILPLEKGSKKGQLPWKKAGPKTKEVSVDGEIKIVSKKGHHMANQTENAIRKHFPAKIKNLKFSTKIFSQIELEHLDSSEMGLAIITTETPYQTGQAQEAWNIRKKVDTT